jgi:hypothetical protein
MGDAPAKARLAANEMASPACSQVGDGMRILGFNRVELLMSTEDLNDAVGKFNDLLGTSFSPPRVTANGDVLTTIDWDNKVELYGPAHPESPLMARITEKGKGAIGPLVWEVDDIDGTREYVVSKGYRIHFEYEEPGIKQIILDPSQFYGYLITFIQRSR